MFTLIITFVSIWFYITSYLIHRSMSKDSANSEKLPFKSITYTEFKRKVDSKIWKKEKKWNKSLFLDRDIYHEKFTEEYYTSHIHWYIHADIIALDGIGYYIKFSSFYYYFFWKIFMATRYKPNPNLLMAYL